MADGGFQRAVPSGTGKRPKIDATVAHPARVYNYWLGGKDNFAVDRAAGERAREVYPHIIQGVRAQREFLAGAVRYLTAEAGIRQFLDIGTGIPAPDNTHEVADSVAPGCRVVYVDNDPMVLAHARALLTSTRGRTAYLDADLRDTGRILSEAAQLLDFGKPIAIMLIGILQLIPDEDDPRAIVARLLAAVPAGSWLCVAHPTKDVQSQRLAELAERLSQATAGTVTFRTHAEVSRFFGGLTLLEPGVVQLHQWRPGAAAGSAGGELAAYCGLGRKP